MTHTFRHDKVGKAFMVVSIDGLTMSFAFPYGGDVSRPKDGNRAVRKAKDRAHLARASAEGKSIKLADLVSNTRSIVAHDPNFSVVYLREKRALLPFLTEGDAGLFALATELAQ